MLALKILNSLFNLALNIIITCLKNALKTITIIYKENYEKILSFDLDINRFAVDKINNLSFTVYLI